MKKLIFVALILAITQQAFSQSIRNEYEKSQRDADRAAQNQARAAQAEVDAVLAAKKYGSVFYCSRIDTLFIFYGGRVFDGRGGNLDSVKGTVMSDRTKREEKVYYKVAGDWISWDDSWIIHELNMATGDIYYKMTPAPKKTPWEESRPSSLNADKAGCKQVR